MQTFTVDIDRTTLEHCFVNVNAVSKQDAIEKAKRWIKAVEDGKAVPAPDWGQVEDSAYKYKVSPQDADQNPDGPELEPLSFHNS